MCHERNYTSIGCEALHPENIKEREELGGFVDDG